MAAAKIMLDEVHPLLPQPKTDHNAYTLGSISSHNVVMACLPFGVYGTISASTVLSHMVSTYTNIRFGLMVGVGGGVPSKSVDIRLGDVVVSKPTATSAGVIQYDYGKTLQDGRFQQTGSLNKPPPVLLKAVAQMESDFITGKRLLMEIMIDALRETEEVREQFTRPKVDCLFKPTYIHEEKEADCSACDQNQLMHRTPRTIDEPYIHYGLVASGDQVIKDAMTRDSLARELDILCFEMEAAGLMDELPSLIIRGISDYCDSHKNKQWQRYAAFAAAAYAKALLSVTPTYQLKKELRESKGPIWMVPFSKNRRFAGREREISEIKALLMQPDGPSKVAICGLGGVGKTQIALELAYQIRIQDPECSVFWIPCIGYESVEQGYMSIASKLGLTVTNPAEVKEEVKTYLSQESAGEWLLLFDNADDAEMWHRGENNGLVLTDFLPQSQQGHILFTTRSRKIAVKLASPYVVTITEPDGETAVEILQKSLIKKNLLSNGDIVIALLQQLVFLPLAITQAAAYINENSISLSDYITLLHEQEADVIELLSEDFGDEGRYKDIQNPVATTWWISFQQIQRSNQTAIEYLSFMSCVSPRNIPQSLLPQGVSRKKKIDAIGLLKAFSFLSAEGTDHSLNLHRLVHLATRNWLRVNQQFSLQISKTADQLSEIFPNDDPANRKLWRQYLPHALQIIREAEFQKEQAKYDDILWNIGNCLFSDGRYKEAEERFMDLLEIRKHLFGQEGLGTLACMNMLALTYRAQGRRKDAEDLDTQVMETCKQVFGPEDYRTLHCMVYLASTYRDEGRRTEAEELEVQVIETRKHVLGQKQQEQQEQQEHLDSLMASLASTYRNQGRWKEAEELEVHVLGIRKQVLGPEHPDTLSSMADLASTYRDQERWKEAEELEVHILEIRKQVLGPEHPDTLSSMADLASTYRDQERWKEAEELEVHILEIRKQVLGPEHPDTLSSMADLASTYRDQERWKEAEELEVHILEIRKQVLGPEHPDTLSSMADLASTYRDQERWKEAEELEVHILEIRKQVLGPEHPDTLSSMADLASTYRDQERWKEAEELEVHVLEIRKQVLGPEHPDTLRSMQNLGVICQHQGRWKDAGNRFIQATEIRKQVLGPTHPNTLESMAALISTNWCQGRWKEAEEIGGHVLEIQRQVFGPEHPATLTSMYFLALIHQSKGQWKEAEELGMQLLEKRKQILGSKHPNTLTSIANLASIYRKQGRWKESEDFLLQVIGTRKQVLGPKHPNTLNSMANLALTYQNQGRWKEAEEIELHVIEIRKKVLGLEHPDTLTTMVSLASTYQSLGRWKEAEELGTQALEMQKQVVGPEHPDTLTTMASLASIYRSLGRWKEAEELGTRALELQKQVVGPEHPDTLTTMASLASIYRSLGRWKEAEELGTRALELQKQVVGPEHRDALTTVDNLTSTWKVRGKAHAECVALHKKLSCDHSDTLIPYCPTIHSGIGDHAILKHPWATSQRECNQYPLAISATVAVSKPDNNDHNISFRTRTFSTTPIRRFFEGHPLLLASRSADSAVSAPRAQNLGEVD